MALDESSPARAGMNPAAEMRALLGQRFPRARGDAPRPVCPRFLIVSSPPRARGCTLRERPPERESRVSPARAGMNLRGFSGGEAGFTLPRVSGDEPAAT